MAGYLAEGAPYTVRFGSPPERPVVSGAYAGESAGGTCPELERLRRAPRRTSRYWRWERGRKCRHIRCLIRSL